MGAEFRFGTGHRVLAFGAGILASVVCAASDAQELTGYTGKELYKQYCASCHGVEGYGNARLPPA